EAASRTKDEFLATISHELRTPLNAMLGWIGMLRAGKLDEATAAKALDIIERNAWTQAQLIEDILDVSRIITGRLRLNICRVDLPSAIRQAVDVIRPAADAKEISIQLLLDMNIRPVPADPSRLQQIVWNLLSNAVKFTPRGGGVRVQLETINSSAEITVSDTGEGISPEFLPYVFDRFRQADSSFSRKHGGLGLGLSIVRYLVELHGGTAQALSDGKGKGATFKVTLPLMIETDRLKPLALDREGQPLSTGSQPEYPQPLQGTSVLVVEEDDDGREMLVTTLKSYGAHVTSALSASQALEAIKRSAPDLLLSDIEIPGEDGYSLIRKVRSLEGAASRVVAIALTAHTRAEDRARALAAGFHSHIAKPVDPKELIDLISSLTRKSRAV
ncbi:MAG TPA: ATP-binding protein, partial [Blastocatellia bacterium]|nr:ATP-binding protein [Blastocatellia bacterium]